MPQRAHQHQFLQSFAAVLHKSQVYTPPRGFSNPLAQKGEVVQIADTETAAEPEIKDIARARGFRLVKSRRRKPGGDFGRYGLVDLDSGRECMGFGDDGLTADADEVLAYLMRALYEELLEEPSNILFTTQVNPDTRVRDLTDNQQRPYVSDHGIDDPIAIVVK